MPPTSTTRGKLIAGKRAKLGLSQEALAQQCGCSVRTIQRIESGESAAMSQRMLASIGARLDLSIERLVTGKRSARGA